MYFISPRIGAFIGDGARLYGGQWNSKGVAMIYTAGSLALTSIEIVVNLPSPKLLETFIRIPARFKPDLVESLPTAKLPRDWQSRPITPTTRAIGDRWIQQQRSAVLMVPSVVVPEEFNYLLNPAHPDFGKIIATKITMISDHAKFSPAKFRCRHLPTQKSSGQRLFPLRAGPL